MSARPKRTLGATQETALRFRELAVLQRVILGLEAQLAEQTARIRTLEAQAQAQTTVTVDSGEVAALQHRLEETAAHLAQRELALGRLHHAISVKERQRFQTEEENRALQAELDMWRLGATAADRATLDQTRLAQDLAERDRQVQALQDQCRHLAEALESCTARQLEVPVLPEHLRGRAAERAAMTAVVARRLRKAQNGAQNGGDAE